jgi:tRNA-2-methylthio-N6-dimethylallyladenosine synthase
MSYGHTDAVWPDDHQSQGGYEEPLSRLLEAVSGVEGIQRVRFTSGHPSGCTEELVKAMAELPEVCEHLHLPVQSGSDRILEMMRRGYTAEDYKDAAARLRKAMPEIGLTTDVIVGFPTETEEEFEMTRRFMDEVGFDQSFIFKYSPRPGTAALKWDDDVSDEEKLRRNKVLLVDQDRRATEIGNGMIGKTVEVLVQGVSLRNSERWVGRTGSNKIVVFNPVDGVVEGDMVRVIIRRAMPQTLYGEIQV